MEQSLKLFEELINRSKSSDHQPKIDEIEQYETDFRDVNLSGLIEQKDIKGKSFELYWANVIQNIAFEESHPCPINKYFMPRYMNYVVVNYLPQCGLWSRLLLDNLKRHCTSYNIKENPSSIGVRSLNTYNNTNPQVEVFFKIKKLLSFKGRTGLRLDKFIEENWKDNLSLKRDFVKSIDLQ